MSSPIIHDLDAIYPEVAAAARPEEEPVLATLNDLKITLPYSSDIFAWEVGSTLSEFTCIAKGHTITANHIVVLQGPISHLFWELVHI